MKCPEGTEPGHKAEGREQGEEWVPAAAVDKSLWAKVARGRGKEVAWGVARARVLAGEPDRAEKAWAREKETNNKPIQKEVQPCHAVTELAPWGWGR